MKGLEESTKEEVDLTIKMSRKHNANIVTYVRQNFKVLNILRPGNPRNAD